MNLILLFFFQKNVLTFLNIPIIGTNIKGLHALLLKCRKEVERISKKTSFCNPSSFCKSYFFTVILGISGVSVPAPFVRISPKGPDL